MKDRILMPCIPLRGLSIFPRTILHFDIGREKSIKALEAAMNGDKLLFVTSQKDENILIPTPDDYYHVGTVVKVKQMLKIQGDAVRVLVDGQYRATIEEIITEEPFIQAEIEEAEIIPADSTELEVQAMMRSVLYAFDEYIELNPAVKEEVYDLISSIGEPDIFADTIAMQMDIKTAAKQELLEAFDVKTRLEVLNRIILEENQILRLEHDISEKVQEAVKQNQKEYILREQMKAIQDELGYGEEAASEAARWGEELEKLERICFSRPWSEAMLAEELDNLSDCRCMLTRPLCIRCKDGSLLEQALRIYQGRALYDGGLPEEKLLPLVKKYGLII